jgi:hypothetical protein
VLKEIRMPKSAEDVGREVAQSLWHDYQKTGVINNAIIAAAIREDRAEMVSETEVETAWVAYCEQGNKIGKGINRFPTWQECIRAALEAARKARAG